MYVSVLFTPEELERLAQYMDEDERVEDTVHGIVLMVLSDLDAQRGMDQEWWDK